MARLAIFIDGGYIQKISEKEFGVWINFQKFPTAILTEIAQKTPEPLDLLRTYFYDCLPYQSNPPSEEEKKRFAARRRFFEFLRREPRFEVREGRLAFRGQRADGSPIFQQKGVDLQLGLDFALLSGKRQITHAAIVAGDSDLVPAFEVATQEGISVWLFHGPRRSAADGSPTYSTELWDAADERFEMDKKFIKDCERKR